MERDGIGVAPLAGAAPETTQNLRPRAALAAGSRRLPAEEPALPFWLVTLLFLGLPITLAGILLLTWMALFG